MILIKNYLSLLIQRFCLCFGILWSSLRTLTVLNSSLFCSIINLFGVSHRSEGKILVHPLLYLPSFTAFVIISYSIGLPGAVSGLLGIASLVEIAVFGALSQG